MITGQLFIRETGDWRKKLYLDNMYSYDEKNKYKNGKNVYINIDKTNPGYYNGNTWVSSTDFPSSEFKKWYDQGYIEIEGYGEDDSFYRKHFRYEIKLSYDYDGKHEEYTIWYHTQSGYNGDNKEFIEKGESIWSKIVAIVKAIIKFFTDIYTIVLNWIWSKVIYAICNGVRVLINGAFGEGLPYPKHVVTIESIVNNKFDLVSMNYWNPPRGSVAEALSGVVDFWYVKFRQMAITCYLIMLLYLGIRMTISKNATTLEAIKDRLNTWIAGVLALFFLPYGMYAVYEINNTVIAYINEESDKEMINSEIHRTTNVDMMETVLRESSESIVCGIIYIVMAGELMVMVFAYYKRAFTVGFLITFFPIVCIKHLFDGINSRRQRACSWRLDKGILCSSICTINSRCYLCNISRRFC